MVYIQLFKPRKGIRPSPAALFDYNNLTPTQKLTLASCRIFSNLLNSNYSQNMRVYKNDRKINWDRRLDQYQFPIFNPRLVIPTIDSDDVFQKQINFDLYQRRKMRILMKGIKVGVKKGGERVNIIGVMNKLL